MEYAIGFVLGLGVAIAAEWIGFDQERSFYPTVLIVIAAYYVLFAAMGASYGVLAFEVLVAAAFLLAAVVSFRFSLWVVAAALVIHGLFDYIHEWFVESPAVPPWWPGLCIAVDVTLGFWLMGRLMNRSNNALQRDAGTATRFRRG